MSQHSLEPSRGNQIAQAEQIDVIGGSQEDLDQLPGQFHDAQEMGARLRKNNLFWGMNHHN